MEANEKARRLKEHPEQADMHPICIYCGQDVNPDNPLYTCCGERHFEWVDRYDPDTRC